MCKSICGPLVRIYGTSTAESVKQPQMQDRVLKGMWPRMPRPLNVIVQGDHLEFAVFHRKQIFFGEAVHVEIERVDALSCMELRTRADCPGSYNFLFECTHQKM